MISGISGLKNEIHSRRKYGRTTCVIEERKARIEGDDKGFVLEIDSFLTKLGFTGLGDQWTRISSSDAKTIGKTILEKDLAYKIPMMSQKESSKLAESFFSYFAQNVTCFTNGNEVLPLANPGWVLGASSPISTATFDTGVVCIDDNRIGILLVGDED